MRKRPLRPKQERCVLLMVFLPRFFAIPFHFYQGSLLLILSPLPQSTSSSFCLNMSDTRVSPHAGVHAPSLRPPL
ncbi:hypothetical protein K438DRAFT_1849207 [Mycena galopus ATCC 62051]|nr:hypothetical protein K438DRAFT_1849207 [Mycena galopus ATCC 62051]